MKRNIHYLTVIVAFLVCSSCNKEEIAVDKTQPLELKIGVNQEVSQDANGVYIIPAYTFIRVNASSTTVSTPQYTWDFGDGRTVQGEGTDLYYEEPGNYTLSLKRTSGEINETIMKQVKVVNSTLKNIRIESMPLTSMDGKIDLSNRKNLNLIFRIYEVTPEGDMPVTGDDQKYDSKLVYESDPIKLNDNTPLPIVVNVQDKNVDLVPSRLGLQPHTGTNAHGYCLYVVAEDGEHMVFTSWGSGAGVSYKSDSKFGITEMTTGNPGIISMEGGAYEPTI